jgi:hypothetical protein
MATPPLRGRASEREALDRLIAGARDGQSGVLVIRGAAGIGKTTLMRYAAGQATAFRVVEIAGVESERELPFAGLQQFCRPLLDRLDALAQPQRDALDVAFGLAPGAAPDRFLVGLATLTLVAAYADEQPVLALVDDLQWLDEASAQVLGFVARRLHAEPVAIVFGVRGPGDPLGLPELHLEGLDPQDAAALLSTVVAGRLDERVRDRLIAETGGNPLALLELPRGMSAAELAGGFALPGPLAPTGIEDAVRQRRIDPLPADTRRLLQLAAADPVGEPLLVWRAAERLGIDPGAAAAAVDAGVLDLGPVAIDRGQEPECLIERAGVALRLRRGEQAAGAAGRVGRQRRRVLEKRGGGRDPATGERASGRALELFRHLLVRSGRRLRPVPCAPVRIEVRVGDVRERAV